MADAKLVFYAACRAVGLFAAARWLTRKRLKILCYHGFELGDETRFRPKLFIDGATFDRRLATISRHGMTVLGLDEAVRRLHDGTLPEHALVLTIDDGFHSVHRVAAPLLQQHGMTATVYVTTYYVEHPNPIFRLAVQYMFWKTRQPSVTLPDGVGAPGERLALGDAAARERAAWRVIRHGETRCTEAERHALSASIGLRLQVPYDTLCAGRAMHLMTPHELAEVEARGLTLQLHTHRHVFPDDDEAAATREIADNRAALSRLTGRAGAHFGHFCYPSGLWTEAQWQWLDAAGVRSSTTCLPGLNSRATPRHALRRFLDGANIHPLEFEAALCGFSDLLRELRDRVRRPPSPAAPQTPA